MARPRSIEFPLRVDYTGYGIEVGTCSLKYKAEWRTLFMLKSIGLWVKFCRVVLRVKKDDK